MSEEPTTFPDTPVPVPPLSPKPIDNPGTLEMTIRDRAIAELAKEVDQAVQVVLNLCGYADFRTISQGNVDNCFHIIVTEGKVSSVSVRWSTLLQWALKPHLMSVSGRARGDRAVQEFLKRIDQIGNDLDELRSNSGL